MQTKNIVFKKGFTLVEMMVALSLFTIVITIASGSLLSLIGANARGQGEQNVMSTMTFALDSMTREIRTGTSYWGDSAQNVSSLNNNLAKGQVKDSSPGVLSGISFTEGGSSITGNSTNHRIAYYYDSSANTIMRQVDGDTPEPIISDDINVTAAKFFVTDTQDLNNVGNAKQPCVTIIISAQDKNDTSASPKTFTLQTTVTQRELDL